MLVRVTSTDDPSAASRVYHRIFPWIEELEMEVVVLGLGGGRMRRMCRTLVLWCGMLVVDLKGKYSSLPLLC